MKNIFARTEKKYIITTEQYQIFLHRLQDKLKPDKYPNYKICNIYYDTDNYDLFRKSIDKPVYKEKLRLRSYDVPNLNSPVFLEIKKKFKGVVYKRRIDFSLKEAYEFLKNKQNILNTMNENEILYLLKRYELKPKVYLSYDRKAYSWYQNSDFRITFDDNIKYRLENVQLEYGDEGKQILDDGFMIMELKSNQNLPLEFVSILSELKIYPISFSKIGTVYKNYIIKGDN